MRRLALILIALIALALVPETASAARGFRFGVTAGDVRSTSAILWARANRTGRYVLQVRTSRRFGRCPVAARRVRAPAFTGASGRRFVRARVTARRSNDKTVQKRVTRLRPATQYFYRFCARGRRSEIGRFETAPRRSSNRAIEFALTGDYDATPRPGTSGPYWNNFQVWRQVARERNDFNIALGDTIYSDPEVPGFDNVPGRRTNALTVRQKWAKYRLNLGRRNLVRARESTGFYSHWDDHEFINDFARPQNEFDANGTVRIDGDVLYRRSVRAFRDYSPITYSSRNGIYRRFRWGRNVEFFFLDERSFRSARADYGGACDNPQTGDPDFAPTAPQTTRNVFAVIAPSLAEPVSPECTRRINDPDRTYLGRRQLARFKRAVDGSTARFKVVVNELPILQLYTLPYDRWEGYEAERQEVLRFLRDNVRNVVFMSTDIHANLVGDARLRTIEPGGPVNSGILDITAGPVATKTFNKQIDDATNSPGAGDLASAAFFKPPPPGGLGLQCAATDVFSYMQVRVTSSRITVQHKDLNGNPVREDDGTPCGPFRIARE